VVGWLRKKLRVGEKESVFLYVNSSFAPSLDEVVGNLHRVSGKACFLGDLGGLGEGRLTIW
jgi:hypothetical protein